MIRLLLLLLLRLPAFFFLPFLFFADRGCSNVLAWNELFDFLSRVSVLSVLCLSLSCLGPDRYIQQTADCGHIHIIRGWTSSGICIWHVCVLFEILTDVRPVAVAILTCHHARFFSRQIDCRHHQIVSSKYNMHIQFHLTYIYISGSSSSCQKSR